MTDAPGIAEFLLDRVTEDEDAARLATDRYWRYPGITHLARQSPDRVLAECEAKRRIVGLLTDALDARADRDPDSKWAGDLHLNALYLSTEALASVYADHPDYRDEWR